MFWSIARALCGRRRRRECTLRGDGANLVSLIDWGKNRSSKLRGVNVQEVMELTRVIRKRNKTNCECHHLLGSFFSVSHRFLLKQNSSVGYSRNLWLNTSVAFSALPSPPSHTLSRCYYIYYFNVTVGHRSKWWLLWTPLDIYQRWIT